MSHLTAHFSNRLRTLPKQRLLSALVVGVALVPSLVSPAAARPRTIFYSGRPGYQSGVSTHIFGSPIPAPVPVNPVTGQIERYDRDSFRYGSYRLDQGRYERHRGRYRGRIEDSVLVNPTIINSEIEDSVLVNPRIIDRNRRYQRVRRVYRHYY